MFQREKQTGTKSWRAEERLRRKSSFHHLPLISSNPSPSKRVLSCLCDYVPSFSKDTNIGNDFFWMPFGCKVEGGKNSGFTSEDVFELEGKIWKRKSEGEEENAKPWSILFDGVSRRSISRSVQMEHSSALTLALHSLLSVQLNSFLSFFFWCRLLHWCTLYDACFTDHVHKKSFAQKRFNFRSSLHFSRKKDFRIFVEKWEKMEETRSSERKLLPEVWRENREESNWICSMIFKSSRENREDKITIFPSLTLIVIVRLRVSRKKLS